MDARNEFKVMFSPESKGMKERITKVFSPSHFLHAQKKKSFYKALSGLSFHDSNAKDRKSSTNNESAGSSAVYMSRSEGYTPKHASSHENGHQGKNKSDKFLRRTMSEKSVTNDKSSRKSSYDSVAISDESKIRENVVSQRTRQKSASLLYDNLASDSRRLRTSIGGYDNVKRSFGSYDNIKKPDQKDQQYLPSSSNDRPKNRSQSINHIIVNSETSSNDTNSKQEYPIRPQRTRSISQSRRLGTINAPDPKAIQRNFENNNNLNTDNVHRANVLVEKYDENYSDNLKELKDVDVEFRSRSRRKSEKSCNPELRLDHSSRTDVKNVNEEGKRQSRYIKNKRSSISNSQLTSKKILPDDINRRVSLGSVENSSRIKAYSRQNSEETNPWGSEERKRRFRSRSVITPCREQLMPLDQGGQYNNDQPLRPRRARSTSKSKAPIVSNIFNIANRFKLDEPPKSNYPKNEIDLVDHNDSGLEDNDSCNRSRSKRKSEKSSPSNNMHRRSKHLNDHSKQENVQSGEEKDDGGYYSLEKEENITDITKPVKNSNQEYFQSDQDVEAIYISQVFMNIDNNNLKHSHLNRSDSDFRKRSYCDDYQTISHILGEELYDNCQRSSSEQDDSTINADDYQITHTVEETEIYEVPFDSTTPDDNDEDLYETIEFSNYEQVDNSHLSPSLPIVDDSDEEGDYMDIKDFPAIKSETKVTVITIKDKDVEVIEKTMPSSKIPIKTPAHGRHNGYFNPYVGKKLSQPSSGEIYDNMIKSTSRLDNFDDSKYSSEFDSLNHSYPMTKAMIPKLPERNRRTSSTEPVNTPFRLHKPNSTKQNNINRYNAPIENSKKTSIDCQKNNGFEFHSETNYKLDNLDYTFKLNFSQLPKGSPQAEFVRKTSFRSKKVSLTSHQGNPFGDLLPPCTFQDLLNDKHINPPENEVVLDTQFCDTLRTNAFLYPESHAQKQMDALVQNMSIATLNRTLQCENSNQLFDDNISVCWSEADSEFEFMNVTK
ncbi:unnamed protein product [Meganyctiphanes norvegica]|uniref:Uncharacterized protein n=1 Tax=Meganyctiphanes norvegica TaxID=48144 RepID=A0AAV2PI10_MEGNR